MNLNFNQLYIFYVIAEIGSIGLAAKKICISVPAVSMQLKKLELLLGFTLFIRLPNSVELTEEAKEILPIIQDMFSCAQELNCKLENMQKIQNTTLLMGAQSSPAQELFPQILRYVQTHSSQKTSAQFDMQVVIGTHEEHIKHLKEEKINIAILNNKPKDDSILLQKFLRDEIVFAVSGNNTRFDGNLINMEQLSSIPMLMPLKNSGFAMHVNDFLDKNNINPNIAMKEIPTSVAKSLVPGSQYGAFFSSLFIREELKMGTLKVINLNERIQSFFYFAYLTKHKENVTLNSFLKLMENVDLFTLYFYKDNC